MTTADVPVDGRHRRREANRDAVVEALLAFYREGRLTPSTGEIAERAGISARSLFRYFDDSDAMTRTAIARQQEHLAPLYDHGADPQLPLPERIERFVAGRTRLLAEMGEVGRLARGRSIEQPLLAVEIRRIRSVLRQQVASLFDEELRACPSADRAATLSALDVAASWEVYDLLRNDQGLSAAAAARTMAISVARLLQAEGG
jgi:TetR/AcrR family transcriptional regulator, regulator of autoinduction and epiphytic fitness